MKGTEDHNLVSACQKGHVDAFEALVEKYQKKMFNIAYRMIGDYEEACEVVQDAFVSAYKAIGKFREEAKFSTWMHSIVVNHSKNRLQQLRTRLHREGPSIDDPVENEEGSSPMGIGDILTQLKTSLGTGGTVRDTSLEIQGDHQDSLMAALEKMGYRPQRSGG